MFLTLVVLVICFCDQASSHTYPRHPFTRTCQDGQTIRMIKGFYLNGDRIYGFYCGLDIPSPTGSCTWYNDTNELTKDVSFTCPNAGVITGFSSTYYSSTKDRIFSVRCCDTSVTLTDCIKARWANDWRHSIRFSTSGDHVLIGFDNVYSSTEEDRRWKFRTCKVA